MECRAFHRKLEDYLEDGLDFSGRFGMERHAQQCIGCGKELADAQQLKRMVSELHRVKAPADFESSVLGKIGRSKAHFRFWSVRRYWIYGFEWPSWRKVAFASSGLAVLALGIFYAFHMAALDRTADVPQLSAEPTKVAVEVKEAKGNPDAAVDAPVSAKPAKVEVPKLAKKTHPGTRPSGTKRLEAQDSPDMDYVEYLMPGPDNYTVPVRLPKRIPMRYSQMSEEYFIRNVSH
jgi:hypothetical protein